LYNFVALLRRIWFGHSLTIFFKRECNFHERWILLLCWSRRVYKLCACSNENMWWRDIAK